MRLAKVRMETILRLTAPLLVEQSVKQAVPLWQSVRIMKQAGVLFRQAILQQLQTAATVALAATVVTATLAPRAMPLLTITVVMAAMVLLAAQAERAAQV